MDAGASYSLVPLTTQPTLRHQGALSSSSSTDDEFLRGGAALRQEHRGGFRPLRRPLGGHRRQPARHSAPACSTSMPRAKGAASCASATPSTFPDHHLCRRARFPPGRRRRSTAASSSTAPSCSTRLRGHGPAHHDHHAQGLRWCLRRHELPNTFAPTSTLPTRPLKSRSWEPEGAVNIIFRNQLASIAEDSGREMLPKASSIDEYRESVLPTPTGRPSPWLHRRGDPARGDPRQGDPGPRDARQQARRPAAEEARQHPALARRGSDVPEDPDRQSRGDRGTGDPRVPRDGHPDGGHLLRRGPRGVARALRRRGLPVRRAARAGVVPGDGSACSTSRRSAAPTRSTRATASCRRTTSSPRTCAPMRGVTFIGSHRPRRCEIMGDKVRGPRDGWSKAGVPVVPGSTARSDRRRRVDHEDFAEEIGLPDPAQGLRRRRRQGDAVGALLRTSSRSLWPRAGARARPSRLVRRRYSLFIEKFVERAAPHRGAGDGRHPRQHCVHFVRARVLDPAPAPEADRGGAVGNVVDAKTRAEIR